MPTGAVRALLECLLLPLRHQLGMAHFDRSAFKILGNVIVVSRHLPKHFYYVQFVHSQGHAACVIGSLAIGLCPGIASCPRIAQFLHVRFSVKRGSEEWLLAARMETL